MTLETCKVRLEIAKKAGDDEQVKFWEKRILNKMARHPDKYPKQKAEVKAVEQKPKR